MRKNKEFMKAYKLFCYMKSSMENLHSTFINFKMFQSEVSHNQNTSPHDILFLQRMYTSYHPRFGCGGRTNIDYYKALDMDSFRNNSGQNDIGVWKRCFDPCQKRSSDLEKAKEYLPLSMTYFDWRMFYERTRIYDKELFDEISALEHNCTEQQINELIKDRCVIVSNENLDYTTLLKEYYSNFGMDSVEFSQMIQKKYGCEVKTSEKKTSGTKMMVYSSSHAK